MKLGAENIIVEVVIEIYKAWSSRNKALRTAIVLGIIFFFIGLGLNIFRDLIQLDKKIVEDISTMFGIFGAGLFVLVFIYRKSLEYSKEESHIEQVETRYRENPQETQAAWDLARTTIESYLKRNLSHVRSIYMLTIVVMVLGFGLIIYGVIRVYESPSALHPSILVAVSGVLVNFIGASLMHIYKTTMSQAKEYMKILERINAVGMSLHVLSNIESSNCDLKDKTISELSKLLLQMYSISNEKQIA